MHKKLQKCFANLTESPGVGKNQLRARLLSRMQSSTIESLEGRWLLSTTAIISSDAIPFNKIVIDPNPGTTPVVKVLGDLTNSGKLDAIIGHESTLGGGGLDWYQFPASGNPGDPWIKHIIDASADCDEQGAVANVSGHVDSHGNPVMDVVMEERGTVVWYENPLGNGQDPTTATWNKHVIGALSQGSTHEMVLTDLDGDGKLDVVTNDAIFFQNSSTSWAQIAAPTYNRTERGLYLFNSGSGLGSVDLAGTSQGPNFQIGWYQNPRDSGGNARTGTWTFHAIAPAYAGFQAGDGLSYAAADFNGDGRMDIITAEGESASPLTGGLIWWEAPINPATGTWIAHTIDSTLTDVYSIVLGDMNGDGQPEILAFEQDQSPQGRLMIVYNEGGTGQNWLEQTLDTGAGQNEKAGDISGNGNLDILSSPHGVTTGVNPISVYMNQLAAQGIVTPTLTSNPVSQSGYVNGSATFSVAAVGPGPLTYQWQLNGLDIPGETGNTCTAQNLQYSSGGTFRCVVGNSAGLIASAGATLTVLDAGPMVDAGSYSAFGVISPLNLAGSVTESALPPGGNLTYHWSELNGTGTVSFADAGSLSTAATFTALGNYVLQLAASDGTVTNASQVTIAVNPLGTIEGSVVSALDGSGISGRTIFVDANQDGQLDGGEISAITDASGNYSFSNLTAGNYQIAQALPADSSSADPGNNVRDVTLNDSQTLTGVSFADLPTPITNGPSFATAFLKHLPSSVVAGATGTATIKIINGGVVTASGPQSLTLLASTTGNFSVSNVVVTTASLGTLTLKPKASKTVTVKFRYPVGLPSGSYSLLAVPDSTNSVPQSSFNIAQSNSVVIAPAFVQLNAALPGRPPKTLVSGKSAAVSVGVSNSGNELAGGNLTISLYESSDSGFDPSDVLLGAVTIQRTHIAAGGHATYHLAFKTPSNVVPGNQYIVAVLDSGSTAASASTITFS